MKTILSFTLVLFWNFTFSQSPLLKWTKVFGANSHETYHVMDSEDNMFITGTFEQTSDFDPNSGTTILSTSNGTAYIEKLDKNGNFQWARNFGSSNTKSVAIDIDINGNLYVTGTFYGLGDFKPGTGNFIMDSVKGGVFVIKFDSNGSFVWAKQFGVSDKGLGVKTDASGNIFVAGLYNGTENFNPGSGQYLMTSPTSNTSQWAGFVIKLLPSGVFQWAKSLDVIEDTMTFNIDNAGNLLIGGTFTGTRDFDPSVSVSSMTAFNHDGFILKLDGNGMFLWAEQIGTSGGRLTSINCFAFDPDNNIHFTGSFNGSPDFNPGSGVFQMSSLDGSEGEIFIEKLRPNGKFLWAKHITPLSNESVSNRSLHVGKGISVDIAGNVYVTGVFNGKIDLDPGEGTEAFFNNSDDTFISKLNRNGQYLWGGVFNSYGKSSGQAISIGANNDIYTTGYLQKADVNPAGGGDILFSTFESIPYALKFKQEALGIAVSPLSTLEGKIVIYPNPSTTGDLTISVTEEWKDAKVTISNIFGLTIKSFDIMNAVTTERLSPGSYFFRFTNANGTMVKKVIVN